MTAPTAGEQGSPPEPWAVKAAQELFPYGTSAYKSRDWERYAAIIARHAPARSQPGEGEPMWPGNYAADPTNWRFSVEEMNKAIARIASLEAELARLKGDETGDEVGCYDAMRHFKEKAEAELATLRAAARPADSVFSDLLAKDADVALLLSGNDGMDRKEREQALNRLLCAQAPRPAAGETKS